MDDKLVKVLDEITWEILDKNPKLEKFAEEYGVTILDLKYSAGYGFTILTCMNYDIWVSEDDEREYIEDKNEYEDWNTYIRRKINNLIENQAINIKKL